MNSLAITYTENYQTFYLKKALMELLGKNSKKKISIEIDHKNGTNNINGIKVPVIFPLYIKNHILTLNKDKNLDYVFFGVISPQREWVTSYRGKNSIINHSDYGRNPDKYKIDENYYKTMCCSKFALTPTNHCPWSYRFFEAIMCMAIPILEKNTDDIYAKDYFYLTDGEEHIYDHKKAIENYNRFINSEHFLHNCKHLNLT